MMGASNAVNLTDGLDGLAIVPVMIAAGSFAMIAYLVGNAIFADYLGIPLRARHGRARRLLRGARRARRLGFLWFNAPPAMVFMGDTGSLSTGGALGAIAVATKHELVLAIIGGLFVLEAVSVIVQVASFKLTGQRVFRMAPLHHHFEKMGWQEPTIVIRFWIIAVDPGAGRPFDAEAAMTADRSERFAGQTGRRPRPGAQRPRRGAGALRGGRRRRAGLGTIGAEARAPATSVPHRAAMADVRRTSTLARAQPRHSADPSRAASGDRQRARAGGVPILGDVELFARAAGPSAAIVGVTGTNGKSTTTALIGIISSVAAGVDAVLGGNIGRPVFELEPGPSERVYRARAVVLSARPVHEPALPASPSWLNLSPDHLDRHGDLAGYIAAKRAHLPRPGGRRLRRSSASTTQPSRGDSPSWLPQGGPGRSPIASIALPADGVCVIDGSLTTRCDEHGGRDRAICAALADLRGRAQLAERRRRLCRRRARLASTPRAILRGARELPGPAASAWRRSAAPAACSASTTARRPIPIRPRKCARQLRRRLLDRRRQAQARRLREPAAVIRPRPRAPS